MCVCERERESKRVECKCGECYKDCTKIIIHSKMERMREREREREREDEFEKGKGLIEGFGTVKEINRDRQEEIQRKRKREIKKK